jgi:hypothetical protein
MADTPKRVIRLIDNIKLELYEGNRKKYAQIWDPTGNNTYNEDDKGPSGIRSPERSKKFQSAEADDDVIHAAIQSSQIVRYYYGKRNSSSGIKEYFNYLQDPFRETPPPKRVYGGGGLGTPEVDNVGPTPYYLNNGCKINIKWTGRIPNPKFILGSFSTPEEAEDYNQSLEPEGPPRWLYDQPILSDIDDSDEENPTLRPQSEWILETYYNPGNLVTPGKTYSNYRDKPYVQDKFVTITLPDGFTENGGKGYLEYIGSGYGWGKGLVYSTSPKGAATSYGKLPSVLDNFAYWVEDKDILQTVITEYKMGVSQVNKIADFTDYNLKVCFPDTGTCSLIPYKSPIVDLSEVVVEPSVDAIGLSPSLITKKVKLNVFGLPGVTSLSGEITGSIKIKAKVSLPDFTVYLGDPPSSNSSDASNLNPFGLIEDDVENPDPYEETAFAGKEEETGIPPKVWQLQNDVSNGQEDSDKNLGVVGPPADVKPVSSFDALIDLAGKCARELGKNARVNAENMKKSYTKGIHGLCPQGTQAVLYALTGVKAVGQISGNADWFSFGPTNPAGGDNKGSFAKSGYFKDKERIKQINGSWKGTYLHKDSKSQWQVGDVIAMAYSGGKSYGHIQVWTGYSWMSDFKQGNSIQQNHVNPDSVALWRLSDKGIAAIKTQNSNVA